MTYTERIVNIVLRGVFHAVCRLDIADLRKLPRRGPAILMANHTTNIEGPAYYLFIQPRPATALGKRELWDNPFTRFFMDLWGIIPVARGQVDRRALRAAFRALDDGKFLGIAPEGTRSATGVLRSAQPGIAMLATKRPVPIYPVVHWGFLNLGPNLKRVRRTRVTIRVGRPFRIPVERGSQLSASDLRAITDEMMYQLAAILPARFRGDYADVDRRNPQYLEFLDA